MKRLIVLFAVFMLIFNGCIEKKIEVKKNPDNYIIYNMGKIPDNLILMNYENSRERDMLYFLFEGLVRSTSDGGIEPAIAESWEVSKDGISYTFNIRENAKWSDGTEITASDFVDFFSEILARDVDNDYDSQLNCIYGVSDYRKNVKKFNEVAITALDKLILQIRLNNANPDLLKILSQPIYSLRKNVNSLKNWRINYKDIRYSGPYQIDNIKDDGSITLTRNTNYWDKDSVENNQLVIVGNENKEAALADFETFKVNVMTDPPLSEISRLTKDRNTLVVYTKNIIALTFNFSGREIVKDINFRKVLSEMTDPSEIAEMAFPEFNIYMNTTAFSGTKNVFKDNAFKVSKEKKSNKDYIKKLQEEGPLAIRLVGLNTDKNKKIAKTISDNLKKSLDVSVLWKLYSSDELDSVIKSGEYDLMINEYERDYDSEMCWLEKWSSSSKENLGKYSNLDFENALLKAQLEGDEAKRKKLIADCDSLLKEDLPVIPIFYDVDVIVKSKDIEGVKVNQNGTLDFRNAFKNISEFEQ